MLSAMLADAVAIPFLGGEPFLPGIALRHPRDYLPAAVLACSAPSRPRPAVPPRKPPARPGNGHAPRCSRPPRCRRSRPWMMFMLGISYWSWHLQLDGAGNLEEGQNRPGAA